VLYDQHTRANRLSKSAYKFKSFTLFEVPGNPKDYFLELKKLIEKIFPKRSPLIYFIPKGKPHPIELGGYHVVGLLCACRDYEHYRLLLSTDFLNDPKTKKLVKSILTTPVIFPESSKKIKNSGEHWDKWDIVTKKNIKSAFLCLWRMKSWKESRDFAEKVVADKQLRKCLLNLITVGYHDNLTVHTSTKKEIFAFVGENKKHLREFDELYMWNVSIKRNDELEK